MSYFWGHFLNFESKIPNGEVSGIFFNKHVHYPNFGHLVSQNHPKDESLIVSPELSSVRDYVITHSVCSMCMYVCSMYVVCVCMWYFAKLVTVSTYIDVLSWDLDTMILG